MAKTWEAPTDLSGAEAQQGIFGWYHYIQDFNGDFALAWLQELAHSSERIWEPFCGSGTTLVAAKMLGMPSWGFDISPFMVDVAQVKTTWTLDPRALQSELDELRDRLSANAGSEPNAPVLGHWDSYDTDVEGIAADYPDDKKLRKWIAPTVVERFHRVFEAIASIEDKPMRDFFRVAAAGLLVAASNMKLRPNICYESKPVLDFPASRRFAERAQRMISEYVSAVSSDNATTTIAVGDARLDGPAEADLVFTSPPYPNDMEYVHQTRLELGLLSYVESSKELTALKKRMISSSVKLVYKDNQWQKDAGLEVPGVAQVYKPIAKTLEGRNWGWNAADMVAQYFGGMRSVLQNWWRRLRPGGRAAIVIGDSAFNGVKVPSDLLLSEVAQLEGFDEAGIHVLRRRFNSKHDVELRESVVVLHRDREDG